MMESIPNLQRLWNEFLTPAITTLSSPVSVLILEEIEGKDDDLLFKTLKITDFGLARESSATTR